MSDPGGPAPLIDTRRYRWALGAVGLVVVVGILGYQAVTRGVGTAGVPAGERLRWFAAPIATTDLAGAANVAPPCSPERHDPRALNICLLAQRSPLVLAFFAVGSRGCTSEVDALERLARSYPAGEVAFAAVAVGAGQGETAGLARRRGWTIPVAYDADGRIEQLYGVAACPLIELAGRGGVVAERLIGERWARAGALAPHVRALVASAG